MAKYVALTVRKLKPGSYDDWRKAWEGDPADWPQGVKAYVTRSVRDPNEVIAFGMIETDNPEEMMTDEMQAEQQARTEAMAPYVESIGADGVYEVIDEVSS